MCVRTGVSCVRVLYGWFHVFDCWLCLSFIRKCIVVPVWYPSLCSSVCVIHIARRNNNNNNNSQNDATYFILSRLTSPLVHLIAWASSHKQARRQYPILMHHQYYGDTKHAFLGSHAPCILEETDDAWDRHSCARSAQQHSLIVAEWVKAHASGVMTSFVASPTCHERLGGRERVSEWIFIFYLRETLLDSVSVPLALLFVGRQPRDAMPREEITLELPIPICSMRQVVDHQLLTYCS